MAALKFLIRKELIQFRRNRFIPRLVFAFPVLIMLIAPLVATMEVKNVRVAVVDMDSSLSSQRLISHIQASDNLRIVMTGKDYTRAFALLEDCKADVIVSVPDDFEKCLSTASLPKIKIDANAVNATKGNLGSQYVVQTVAKALQELLSERGVPSSSASQSVRYYYNETMDYRYNMIPAFIIVIVLLICCFLPALNMVQEKEKGTLEQINVTPVSGLEFTLSKLFPYWAIGLICITEAILTVGLVYGLWPAGNVLLIYLGCLLFALGMSGFAVTIANGSDTMQQSIFVLFFFVMIFMLMSGLFTPVSSMPQWAQDFTLLLPTRYFITIMRAVYLKGATFADLSASYLGLTVLALAFSLLAALTYRKRV